MEKPARPQLKRRYGERLEALYGALEEQQREELAALARGGAQAPLEARVRQAVEAVLGVRNLDLASARFADLGGDSMNALTLANLLEETTGVAVPVGAILNPGSRLRDLVQLVEGRRGPGQALGRVPGGARCGPRLDPGGRPAPGPFPDRGATGRSGPGGLPAAPGPGAQRAGHRRQRLPGPVPVPGMAGAHGPDGGGVVHALVRGQDTPAAAARLEAAFQGDPDLAARFRTLADPHLRVLAGDLAAPGLGLEPQDLERLAEEVDLIVHPGALVNHVLGYEQLFPPTWPAPPSSWPWP